MVGGGDLEAVGVEVQVAGRVRKRELEELVRLVGLREPEEAAAGAAGGGDQEALGVEPDAPAHPLDVLLGMLELACSPVFQSKTSTAGLLTAPSGLLALISPLQARKRRPG